MEQDAAPRKLNAVPWALIEPWAAPLILAIAVLAFYAIPLFWSGASIHWDAADVQYPLQRYFYEHLHGAGLPQWTPYIFSGYPLLANPEMGAWYPLNWPFFLLPVSPAAIQCELALNAFVACLGAYLFFRQTVGRTASAILGAFAYGLSGFFAGHSSHVTAFAAAAWFPWILWAYRRTVDTRALSGIAIGGLAGGAMILAGNLPVATFAFFGLGWYALSEIRTEPREWRRLASYAASIVALSLALASAQLLPTAELLLHSKLDMDYSRQSLQFRSLATLVAPNALGTISHKDRGLITNHYLYAGLLLLPLAAFGVRNRRLALAAAAIGVPAFWYALGPSALFGRLGALLPGMQKLGPPDMAWFLVAFALAWLAVAGSDRLLGTRPWVAALLAVGFFGDLWYWNLYRNPLAFARKPFEVLYRDDGARALAAPELPLSRFESAAPVVGVGPLLFPLTMKFETTSGYLLLRSAAYADYVEAMARNPRLRDGLNVGRYLDSTGAVAINASMLPRVAFPPAVIAVADEGQSRQTLAMLNPAVASTVLAPKYALHQDPDAEAFLVRYDEQSYLVHYRTHAPGLLKLAVPYYPGWTARVNGNQIPILRVDHALLGTVLPPGEGDVAFAFRSKYLAAGWTIVVLALLTSAFLFWGESLRRRLRVQSLDEPPVWKARR